MSDRFPAAVEAVLIAAGWAPGRRRDEETAEAVRRVEAVTGRYGARHRASPAAVAALTEFGGLYVLQDGAGEQLRRRPFALDPTLVAYTTETLADLGRVLGVGLFPLGAEGDAEAILAVAADGRVFSLDHAGEWFLGATVEEALTTLVTGTVPPRLPERPPPDR